MLPEHINKWALKSSEFVQLQLSLQASPFLSNRKHQRRGEEIFSSVGNVCTWQFPSCFPRICLAWSSSSNSSSSEFCPSPFKWRWALLTPHFWGGSCSLHVPWEAAEHSCSCPRDSLCPRVFDGTGMARPSCRKSGSAEAAV